jgi:hypothetical protein
MANLTLTKTITQPEEVITAFANDLSYQEHVANPKYVPAEHDPKTFEETKAATGEPTVPNTQSRLEFVSEKFDDFVAEEFLGKFAKRNAEQTKMEEAKAVTQATITAIKSTITTKIG